MIGIAIVGVLANGYAAWRVKGGKSLNEKVISWHLMEDVLGWIAVLIVAIILQFRAWYFLDPALSILITIYILWGVGKRLKETLHLLLQGTPEGVDFMEVQETLNSIEEVESVHHVHVWSLDGEHHVLTAHLVLQNISSTNQIDEIRQRALNAVQKWNFDHHTFQIEFDKEKCPLFKDN